MNAVNSQLESPSLSNSDAIVECVARTRDASAFTVNAPIRRTATAFITEAKEPVREDDTEGSASAWTLVEADSGSKSNRDDAVDDEALKSSEFRKRSSARSEAANTFLLGGRRGERSLLPNAGDIVVIRHGGVYSKGLQAKYCRWRRGQTQGKGECSHY